MSYGLIIVLRFSIILSGQDINRKTTILDGERRVSSKGLLCGGRTQGTYPGDVPRGRTYWNRRHPVGGPSAVPVGGASKENRLIPH